MKQLRLIKAPDMDIIYQEKTLSISPLIKVSVPCLDMASPLILESRTTGEFSGKAFWLNSNFDWHIGIDSTGEMILVPTIR